MFNACIVIVTDALEAVSEYDANYDSTATPDYDYNVTILYSFFSMYCLKTVQIISFYTCLLIWVIILYLSFDDWINMCMLFDAKHSMTISNVIFQAMVAVKTGIH